MTIQTRQRFAVTFAVNPGSPNEKTARLGRFRICESGGDGGNRTHDRGFADPCLNHLATSPCATGAEEGI